MATVIMQGGYVIVCYREYGDRGGFFILSRCLTLHAGDRAAPGGYAARIAEFGFGQSRVSG